MVIRLFSDITYIGHGDVGKVIIEDIVAIGALQHEVKAQPFPTEATSERTGEVRVRVSDNGSVRFGGSTIAIEVGIDDLTGGGIDGQLARDENEVAGADGLAVRSNGSRCLVGV